MTNKVEKVKCNFDIMELNLSNGLLINNQNKNEKITIYDNELISRVVEKNFNKKYREILYIVMDILENDDATDTDTELVLVKIDNLRNLLLNKYYVFLNRELQFKYLNMIFLLEEKLQNKKNRRGR